MAFVSVGRATLAAGLASAVLAAQAESSPACSGESCRPLEEETEDVAAMIQLREGGASLSAAGNAAKRTADTTGKCIGLDPASPRDLAIFAWDAKAGVKAQDSVFMETGWTRGPSMNTTCWGGGIDVAQTYQKDCEDTEEGDRICAYCAIAFSPTDDAPDLYESLNVADAYTSFCGVDGQGKTYVKQLRKFYRSENWVKVQESIAANRCCKTYATGLSQGGALASLFAFCSNERDTRANQFDRYYFEATPTARSGAVRLVTFGAPRAGIVSLYSYEKETCFQGKRYAITDNFYQNIPAFTPELNLEGLEVLATTYWEMWMVVPWMKLHKKLKLLRELKEKDDEDRFEHLLQETLDDNNKWGQVAIIKALYKDCDKVKELWTEFINQDEALYKWSYDPVPTFQPGVFPLLKLGSIAHPVPAPPAIDYDYADCDSDVATTEPTGNLIQTLGGMMGNFIENKDWLNIYPNHIGCCYIDALGGYSGGGYGAGDCGMDIFGNSSQNCPEAKWR